MTKLIKMALLEEIVVSAKSLLCGPSLDTSSEVSAYSRNERMMSKIYSIMKQEKNNKPEEEKKIEEKKTKEIHQTLMTHIDSLKKFTNEQIGDIIYTSKTIPTEIKIDYFKNYCGYIPSRCCLGGGLSQKFSKLRHLSNNLEFAEEYIDACFKVVQRELSEYPDPFLKKHSRMDHYIYEALDLARKKELKTEEIGLYVLMYKYSAAAKVAREEGKEQLAKELYKEDIIYAKLVRRSMHWDYMTKKILNISLEEGFIDEAINAYVDLKRYCGAVEYALEHKKIKKAISICDEHKMYETALSIAQEHNLEKEIAKYSVATKLK